MKILHMGYSDLSGGASKAAYRIHKGLQRLGVDSEMAVSKKMGDDPKVYAPSTIPGKIWSALTPHLEQLPWKLTRTKREAFSSLGLLGIHRGAKLARIDADLVHLHWICAGFMRIEDIPKIKVPLVWRLADMWAFSGAEHYVGDSLRYKNGYLKGNRPEKESGFDFDRWVWRRKAEAWKNVSDLTIVTPSQWMARCARESRLFKNRRIEVIPTGQDTNRFRPVPKEVARDILGLPQEKTLILAGALGFSHDPRKGLHLLRESLNHLGHDMKKETELVFIGVSENEHIPDFGVKAHTLGRLKDEISLAIAYSAANLFVAPSMQENLANTVIEAMACKTPCLAFHIGGMPDIIRHKENGWLAPPFDTEIMAKGMEWLAKNAGEKRLGESARNTVKENFSVEIQAERYLKLYEDILGIR